MNRIRRWHLILFAVLFILSWAGNDCDGRCPNTTTEVSK